MGEFQLKIHNWGSIDYKLAWDKQAEIQSELLENRANGYPNPIVHHLIFCEHPHVFTLGRSGKDTHLLVDNEKLKAIGASFYKINRGGDITYHGPGQIVGYLIFDLNEINTDVHWFVRSIEEIIIKTLAEYGLSGQRHKGYTGVWLDQDEIFPARKICAIGIHLSRWISLHGFALNLNPDLSYFNHIIPCGIQDDNRAVTSMKLELQRALERDDVIASIEQHCCDVFNFTKLL